MGGILPYRASPPSSLLQSQRYGGKVPLASTPHLIQSNPAPWSKLGAGREGQGQRKEGVDRALLGHLSFQSWVTKGPVPRFWPFVFLPIFSTIPGLLSLWMGEEGGSSLA